MTPTAAHTHLPQRSRRERRQGTIRRCWAIRPIDIAQLAVDAFGCAPDVLGQVRLGLRASAKVQRALWGITWNAPVLGDGVALAQEIDLELDVSLVRASSADRSGTAFSERLGAIASGGPRPRRS